MLGQFPADLPVTSGPFDVIATFHVIEHVHDPAAMLNVIRQRLKPGGISGPRIPRRPACRGAATALAQLLPEVAPARFFAPYDDRAARAGLDFGSRRSSSSPNTRTTRIPCWSLPSPNRKRSSPRLPASEVDRVYRTLTEKLAGTQVDATPGIASSGWTKTHGADNPRDRGAFARRKSCRHVTSTTASKDGQLRRGDQVTAEPSPWRQHESCISRRTRSTLGTVP